MKEHVLWSEKYRPETVQECILPANLKDTFQGFVDSGTIPNLLLHGGSGTGKTTVARAMCRELDANPFFINSSMAGNIDTLRTKISDYASTGSILGNQRKAVILDEGDYLNAQSTQPALRGFIEKYARNCSFILTCNYPNRILKELRSRFSNIEFVIASEDRQAMAMEFFGRCTDILGKEGVEFNAEAVAAVISHHFPDFRRTLMELQSMSKAGPIDAGSLAQLKNVNVTDLIEIMKDRNFGNLRQWVAQNVDIDSTTIFRQIYDSAYEYLEPKSLPGVILTLNQGQVNDAIVADRELNLMATLTTLMAEAKFK
jgi:DNA polymerase III delta prime subunit